MRNALAALLITVLSVSAGCTMPVHNPALQGFGNAVSR